MSDIGFNYQTSEKVKINIKIAGASLRIAAYLIDIAILTGAFVVLYFIFIFLLMGGAAIASFSKSEFFIWIILIIYGIIALFYLLYPVIFELVWKGQTPGKRILNIRAVNDNGSYLSSSAIILRNVFRIIDILPVSYLLGFIVMICNKQKKRIGDFVAGSIVIREKKPTIPSIHDISGKDPFKGMKNLKKSFNDHELEIIYSYISCRNDLYLEAVYKIETEMIQIITHKTGIRKPDNLLSIDFIDAFIAHLD